MIPEDLLNDIKDPYDEAICSARYINHLSFCFLCKKNFINHKIKCYVFSNLRDFLIFIGYETPLMALREWGRVWVVVSEIYES